MAKKIQYRALNVQHLSLQTLLDDVQGASRVVVGVDVAKKKFLAALCVSQDDTRRVIRFEHPTQTAVFVDLLCGLQKAGRVVEVVMEPTGTYGDALRYQLGLRSIPVYRVNNKHVHDAAELFDRSTSKHDAKDACLISWLHLNQRSTLWKELPEERRRVRALTAQRELYDRPLRELVAQMEPLMARHFPELETFFELGRRKTAFVLLEKYGSPAELGKAGVEQVAAFLLKSVYKADLEVVKALVHAAQTTTGAPLVADEVQLVQLMASEILRLFKQREQVDARIASIVKDVPAVQAMRPCLGAVTAAVIYAHLGAPNDYSCAAALEKAAGLNLVEKSSGTTVGSKHISKRGAGIVRKYLFLAAMRLLQTDPVAKAWYQARTSFRADTKIKAVVALERKLCRALFHVAAGQPFDTTKLFDTRRLPSLNVNSETTIEAAKHFGSAGLVNADSQPEAAMN